MADKAVDFGAVDTFSLGAGFEPQSNNTPITKEVGRVLDENGDLAAQTTFGTKTEKSVSYKYTGADLDADFTLKLGEVVAGYHIDSISFKFASQEAVGIDITGHNHAENAHAVGAAGDFDGYELALTALIGDAMAGWGVPANLPMANSDTDCDCIGVSLNYALTHKDNNGGAGTHWVGTDADGRVDGDMTFISTPTLISTGFTLPNTAESQGNQDHEGATVQWSYDTALVRTVVAE